MKNEREIILMSVKGNKEAFGHLVNLYSKRLYGFIYGILRDEHDSLDLVQDTFIKAYTNMYKFDINKNFITWLFTIAKNTTFNYLKSKDYKMKIYIDDVSEDNHMSISSEDKAFENFEKIRLINAIESLPEKYRVIIYLKYVMDFSYKEISQNLGIKESLVESRIYTARQKIISYMNEGEKNEMY